MQTGHFKNLLHREVISKGLCTACGACAGVCPEGVIRLSWVIPELVGECSACGSCYSSCPGKEINIADLEKGIFGRAREESEKRIGIRGGCYSAC
ncbi:MAG: 4Fe-4S binding protein, partial [Deltaproteobacteria bacterium]|nr:4Fe-4S binding protein [Deltaproteobacteria bacterium]